MPYIPTSRREALVGGDKPATPGELNYIITEYLIDYVKRHAGYQGINDVLGALEGAKIEFYRRYAAPYEATKILENGDVYPPAESPKFRPLA